MEKMIPDFLDKDKILNNVTDTLNAWRNMNYVLLHDWDGLKAGAEFQIMFAPTPIQLDRVIFVSKVSDRYLTYQEITKNKDIFVRFGDLTQDQKKKFGLL